MAGFILIPRDQELRSRPNPGAPSSVDRVYHAPTAPQSPGNAEVTVARPQTRSGQIQKSGRSSCVVVSAYGCRNQGVVVSSDLKKFKSCPATFSSPAVMDGCVPSFCKSWHDHTQSSLRANSPFAQ